MIRGTPGDNRRQAARPKSGDVVQVQRGPAYARTGKLDNMTVHSLAPGCIGCQASPSPFAVAVPLAPSTGATPTRDAQVPTHNAGPFAVVGSCLLLPQVQVRGMVRRGGPWPQKCDLHAIGGDIPFASALSRAHNATRAVTIAKCAEHLETVNCGRADLIVCAGD